MINFLIFLNILDCFADFLSNFEKNSPEEGIVNVIVSLLSHFKDPPTLITPLAP